MGQNPKYSARSLYSEGEPIYRALERPLSSEAIPDPTNQIDNPSLNDAHQCTDPKIEVDDYRMHWNCLGDSPSEYLWEGGPFYAPSWTCPSSRYTQQPFRHPNATVQSLPPTTMIHISTSESHNHYLRPLKMETEPFHPLFHLSNPGLSCDKASGRPFPSVYNQSSPTSSPCLLPPRGPLTTLTPESSQSPDATTSSFTNSLQGDSDDEDKDSAEPYAKLIYRALMSAPNHCMVLKDIYKWFERYTTKTSSKSKGWQNSIRHNLSMNGGFRKIEQPSTTDEAKKGFVWVLEPWAVVNGIESTTRYRRHASSKKSGKLNQQRHQIMAKPSSALTNEGNPRKIESSAQGKFQYETVANEPPDNVSSGHLPRFMANGDYHQHRRLDELSPYYSLPGDPQDLSSIFEIGASLPHDYRSYGSSFDGDPSS